MWEVPGALPTGPPGQPAIPDPATDVTSLAAPIVLKPVTDNITNLHLVEDVKVIYEAIGKAAGINVIASGDRSVAIGGNATNNTIVTGDKNKVR